MQKVNLNLIPGGVRPVINVSQYDEGRQFQLAVFNGPTAYDLTGKTVTIEVGKPDGNGCAYGVSDTVNSVPVVAVSGNVVTITTPVQMTAVAGDNVAELKVADSDAEIGSLNFTLYAEPAALDPGTPISDTQIPAIERAGWDAVDHYPYIDAVTNHWMVWDVSQGAYVDTGVGAGGGGVTDYNDLTSRPQINGVLLTGNKTAANLGLATDSTMTGASAGTAGAKGLVPAPAAGDQDKILHGDGTWKADKDTDTLTGLTDTDINTPTDGQVLKYDSASSKWVNGNGGGGGASTLAGLSDTNISTPTDAQPLTYDSANSKWINGGVIPTANGGTGNANGFIRTGQKSGTTAGLSATIEGVSNTVTGQNSHGEGSTNTCSGGNSHVEGVYNSVTSNASHVEGAHNSATGYYAHVSGYYNTADYDCQTVVGLYNKNESDSLFEVGNGTSSALADRRNAIAVKSNGRIYKNSNDAFPAASNLAPVEMTRTMSAQRTAGSYVFVAADDAFYKITTTIAASGTLTPGTNATAVSVGGELSSYTTVASVTGGTKTWAQALATLYTGFQSLSTAQKLRSAVRYGNTIFQVLDVALGYYTCAYAFGTDITIDTVILSTGKRYVGSRASTIDHSSETAGGDMSLIVMP